MTWIKDLGHIYDYPNVSLVNNILSEEEFNDLFPDRNYSFLETQKYKYLEYGHFLTAVAQYPAFCGEFVTNAAANLDNASTACKRELATLFAHMTYETSETNAQGWELESTGLKHMEEDRSICTKT